ncbi:MAG: amino acid adenylation domain-containing protein, partial [Kangiellaceae bacterium]|nr:amino acid adenylation domain-containing protein [Kangiellaceae bacterium]
MVITAVPQEKNAISTVNFTHSAVSNHSLVTSNIEDSPDLLILSAWIIQLSKYWGVESLEVGIKSLESSSKNNFCAINLGDQLKSIEMIGILEELTSGRQAPTQEWISLTDIQHYCIIAPQEADIFDDNAFRVWQHPECKFQLLLCGDTQLFPHIDERRVYSHFERVLQQLTQSPHANVISIDCLPEQEYNQLIKHWNDTDRNFPITQCIDELFRTQAARTPNQVAIRFKGQSLSYQQLFTNVSQFSQFLIDQEVAPGDVVGLCLMRTPLWPIGMLAIWSVGAVFLPLEAELPDERLSYILEDSQCKLVITEPLLKERFSGQNQQVSEIKLEQLELFEQWKEPVIKPANTLAYIIYTSGTTGLPKGVEVNHKGLSNLAYCQYERMNFEPNQRVLQAVSFNFDASLHDVTFALLSGSALCIADENERLPGLAMVDFLRNEKINFITLPPSALETLPFEELPNLHTILAVGEVCGSGLVNRWAGVKKFFNGYGPTETTVGALIGECFSNEHKPTIGTALANVKIYILDSRKKPVPIGVVGEIYVGGVGVARGYVNQPDKTANTFIVNPFVDDESATLYKTGDKARFLDDGRVDFIGRID